MLPRLTLLSGSLLLIAALFAVSVALAAGQAVCKAAACDVLLYHSGAAGTDDLFLLDVDRQTQVKIPEQGDSFSAVWSPDGTRIAFWNEAEDQPPAIVVWQVYGGGQTRLPHEPYRGTEITWSPDGREIAYVINDAGAQNIVIADVQTGESRQLTHSPMNLAPSWSPDGTRIAFRSTMSAEFSVPEAIWVMDAADGGNRRRVGDSSPLLSIVWSPDSRSLLFSRYEPRNAAFTTATLAHIETGETAIVRRWSMNSRMAWSADGQRVALVARIPEAPTRIGSTRYEIGIADVISGEWRSLLRIFDSRGMPVLSPDGRRLAFESGNRQMPGVYLIDIETGVLRQLTTQPQDDDPIWQPN